MPKSKGSNVLIPTIIMGCLAVILLVVGYRRGDGSHIAGIQYGGQLLLQVIPLLILAFIVAGMVQELLPREAVARWVGNESGWRGLIFGTIAGGLTPGGPFVNLPIAVGLYKAGASLGVMVAYITGWSLIAVARLPLEMGILGWKLTLVRLCCTFFFPPIAGFIAQTVFGGKG